MILFFGRTGTSSIFIFASCLNRRIPAPCEIRIQKAPHHVRHFLMKSILVSDARKGVIGLSALMDVTDRVQAEETFQRMAETSVDIISLMNARGRVVYCSRAVEHQLGYPPRTVVDKPFETYIVASERDIVRKLFKGVLAGQKIENLELHLLSVDGTPVPFEINARANMLHRSAEDVLIVCVARNITAHKVYREELEKSHREKSEALALLDAIFDSAPIGLGFWDRELRFVRLNKALADFNGLPGGSASWPKSQRGFARDRWTSRRLNPDGDANHRKR